MNAAAALAVQRMRALAAVAFAACQAEGLTPWSVEVLDDARSLRVILDHGTAADADRLAATLGVTDWHRTTQDGTSGAIYTVGSRQPREVWHKPDYPAYFGASAPFDGLLVEVTVTVFVAGR